MITIASQNNLLRSISLSNIISYLNRKGWRREPDLTFNKLFLFKGPLAESGKALELRIPKGTEYVDFYERIADAVNLLSIIENIDPEQVILDIKSSYLDIVNIRVIETGEFGDSLPIEDAYKDITGLRNLIVYAACSEQKPIKHYDAPTAIGQKHSYNCRFGHTFRGSFGFSIESPLMANNINHSLLEPPFERRVIERIARGLAITKQASKNKNPDLLVEAYEKAFNSKMCEALLAFSNGSVELSFKWSEEVFLSEDIPRSEKYYLDQNDFEVLDYAANKLKEVAPINTTILGKIINLHCTTNPDEDKNNRSIIVKHLLDDKMIEVKASLNKYDYLNACSAHAEGRIVSITGELQRTGTTWEITNISNVILQP